MVDSNQILPLYQQVQLHIYEEFKQLQRQSSLVRSLKTKTERDMALRHFRTFFDTFYQTINDDQKIGKLGEKKKKELKKYFQNLRSIKVNNVRHITSLCREVMDLIGITQIEYKPKDPSKAMSKGNT